VPALVIPAEAPAAGARPFGDGASVPAVRSARGEVTRPAPLATEVDLMDRALGALRRARDAQGALALLAEYDRRFPSGTLLRESRLARIDAYLMLGRRAEALVALDGVDLARQGRELTLRLLRGELRARMDCPSAFDDFDAVLAGDAAPELRERALYGRAACWSQLGDFAQAAAEAAGYLSEFPHGRFAAGMRRLHGAPTR
jgi:hypothetical protein